MKTVSSSCKVALFTLFFTSLSPLTALALPVNAPPAQTQTYIHQIQAQNETTGDNRLQALEKENEYLRAGIIALKKKYEHLQQNGTQPPATSAAQSDMLKYFDDCKKQLGENSARLETLEKDNAALKQTLQAKSKTKGAEKENEELKKAQAQNEHLRATIQAQNEMLVSSDNAVKAAERLIQENSVLNDKLTQIENTRTKNERSAQELLAKNETLKKDLANCNASAQQQASTANAANAGNQKQFMRQISGKSVMDQVTILMEEKEKLEQELQKEKENNSAYRTKIREYQEKYESLNEKAP